MSSVAPDQYPATSLSPRRHSMPVGTGFKSPQQASASFQSKPGVLSNGTAANIAANQTPKPFVSLAGNEKTPAYLKSPISKSFGRLLGASKVLSPLPMITREKGEAGKRKLKQRSNEAKLERLDAGLLVDDSKDDGENPFDQILRDQELYRALVLIMALDREPKGVDSKDKAEEEQLTVISEGFYWKDFPELERLLFDSMEQYYRLSTNKRQSKQQQAFNNTLVENIRSTAIDSGYTFDSYFENDDKRLRDRIRCFFKTHLQNAKKRLVTLQKKPDSVEGKKLLRTLIKKARRGMGPTAATERPGLDAENESPRPQKRRRSL